MLLHLGQCHIKQILLLSALPYFCESAERRALREPVSLETSLSFAYLVIIGYDGAFQGYSVSAEGFIAKVAHNED